jgi:hypothetical protein
MKQSARRATHSLIVLCALLVGPSGPALAQADEGWSVGGGIGLTASPTSFLMQLDLPYHFGNGASVGPQLQIGVTGGTTVVSFAANGRYDFDVSMGNADFISDLRPFINGGIGLSYIQQGANIPRFWWLGGNDGIGFLMEFGGGLAYQLNDHVSLETAMQFNIIPDGAGPRDNDHFYWSWQMLGVRYHF